MRVVQAFLLASLSALALWSAPEPARAAGVAQPDRVTVIGDSVLTGVEWNDQAVSILEQGLPDVDLQIAVCRRLTGISCPFEGERPPNLVDTVQSLGDAIGKTVVVEVGYNDPEDGFGDAVDASVRALLQAGVQHILWVNFHDWVPQYARMNTVLAQVLARYPQVTIVDWQAASLNQYSWFQSDGIHLVQSGAVALAGLIRDAVLAALAPAPPPPPPIVARAPAATVTQVGARFSARLQVSGGRGPFRWRVTGHALGYGLHLLQDGVITGTPTRAGRMTIDVLVSDSAGGSAGLQLILTIKPRALAR